MLSATFTDFGAPQDVVSLTEEPATVTLASGQVRVRVLAAPINPADINYIQGVYGVRPELPAVPGMEGCGEVLESKSKAFAIGDRVLFLKRGGLWQEEVVVAEEDLIVLPKDIDPLQACMLGINPLTALLLLDYFQTLEAGDCVLQNAANSNVGRCVIQIAKQRGLVTVNTVRRPELIPALQELGADHVFLDESDLKAEVKELGLSPLLAANCVGGDSALRQLSLLGEEGVQVTYGAMSKKAIKVPNGLMIFKRLRLEGFWVTKWLETAERSVIQERYDTLACMVLMGELRQPVECVYPLKDVKKALAHAQQEGREGKVLLKIES